MAPDMNPTPWTRTADELPIDGLVVEAKDSAGNVQRLRRRGALWFFEDMSMYVYYVPVAWRRT